MNPAWIVPLGVVGFAILWCFVVYMLAVVGGWSALAQTYRSQLPFSGHTWSFRSGRMGMTKYSGLLTIGVNPAGLYLAVLPLFRIGHPPLFIPWHDVTVSSEARFLGTFIVFTFRGGETLALWDRFGREVLERARSGA